MPTIRRVTNPTQRDGYLQLLARRSGVEERVLLEELRRSEAPPRGGGRPPEVHIGAKINLEAVLASPDALDPEAVAATIDPIEFELLRLLLQRPYMRVKIESRLTPELFVSTPARELWLEIKQTPSAGFDRSAFVAGLDPTLADIARTLFANDGPIPDEEASLEQALEQSLLALERRAHHGTARLHSR